MKAISVGLIAALAVSVPLSSASAHGCYYHRCYGPHFGFVGAVVGGVATIVAAPFIILSDVVSSVADPGPRYGYRYRPHYDRPPEDGPPPGYGYPPQAEYQPPRGAYYRADPGYGYPPSQYRQPRYEQQYDERQEARQPYPQPQYARPGYGDPRQEYQQGYNQGPPQGYDPDDN